MKTQRIQGAGRNGTKQTRYYYFIFFLVITFGAQQQSPPLVIKKLKSTNSIFFVSTCHIPLVQKVAELETAVARGQVLGETLYIKKRERRTIHSLAGGTQRDLLTWNLFVQTRTSLP